MAKKYISIVAASIFALTITACSTVDVDTKTDVIPLTVAYENTSTPQWSKQSVEFLEKENWEIVSTSDYMVKKYNIPTPQKFQARNETKTCYITYDITYQNPNQNIPNLNPYYNTQNNMLDTLNFFLLNVKIKETKNETLQVLDDNPAEVLTVKYSFSGQNGVSNNESTFDNVKSSGYQLNRMFNKEVTDHSRFGAVNNKAYPIVSLNYQCIGEEVNPEIWKKILQNAEINFTPLPQPDGEPIDFTQVEGPTLDDRSFE